MNQSWIQDVNPRVQIRSTRPDAGKHKNKIQVKSFGDLERLLTANTTAEETGKSKRDKAEERNNFFH